MAATFLDIIPGTGQIVGQDLYGTIKQQLHTHAPELKENEVTLIMSRTPVLTGALQSDVEGKTYSSGNDLVFLYSNEENQIIEWNRVYALYQEGGDLGLSTYTNAPHEMFGQVLTTDMPLIQEWGNQAAQEAVDLCASGGGLLL